MATHDSIKFNHIPKIIAKLKAAEPKLVKAGAFNVESWAKKMVPVDTGFLKNSIYTVTETTSGSHATVNKAISIQNRHQGGNYTVFPLQGPTNDPKRALVLVGATYGAFVELGTVHSPAQPFLLPAAMQAQIDYIDLVAKMIKAEIENVTSSPD